MSTSNDDLLRLAEGATPSLPSANWLDYIAWIGIGGNPLCRIDESQQNAVKAFIAAANPARVRELVEQVRELERKLAAVTTESTDP